MATCCKRILKSGILPNGICERNYAVTEDCVQKILADNKNIDTERTFACAANV